MSENLDRKNTVRNQKARHKQSQHYVSLSRQQRQTFDNLGLTKRNADYMFRFNKAFQKVKFDEAKKQKIIHRMVNELRAGQKRGETARNQYGTVAHKVHVIVHPPKKKVPMNHNYWPNAFYNMIIFFCLFNILYGITYLLSSKAEGQKGAAGFIGLLVTSVVAGLGMPIITRLFDDRIKHRYNGLIRGLVMIVMFLLWMAVFYLTARLPRVLNPILNPWINIALAVVGVAGAFWIHTKYNVTSAFRSPRR